MVFCPWSSYPCRWNHWQEISVTDWNTRFHVDDVDVPLNQPIDTQILYIFYHLNPPAKCQVKFAESALDLYLKNLVPPWQFEFSVFQCHAVANSSILYTTFIEVHSIRIFYYRRHLL